VISTPSEPERRNSFWPRTSVRTPLSVPTADTIGRLPDLAIGTPSSVARVPARAELISGLKLYAAASAWAIVSADAWWPARRLAAAAKTGKTIRCSTVRFSTSVAGRQPDSVFTTAMVNRLRDLQTPILGTPLLQSADCSFVQKTNSRTRSNPGRTSSQASNSGHFVTSSPTRS
jgi:hypothetical protein